jgi:hypothetical protein
MNSVLIPDVNKKTAARISEYKESIQLISLNGIVFASKLGRRGAALAPIFDHITKTGDFATTRMESLLSEMAESEFRQHLSSLETYSRQAIDLVDRNLFERAADVRWWATDMFFHNALESNDFDGFQKAMERLKVINSNYTMYRDLVLLDDSGKIVANARPELAKLYTKVDASNQNWFRDGMRSTAASQFFCSDVGQSQLDAERDTTLIYSAGVRKNGAREGISVGVLATIFDWETEAQAILNSCLPRKSDGKPVEGSVALYTNKKQKVVASTCAEYFKIGLELPLSESQRELSPGESLSQTIEFNGCRYIIGSTRTKGYREYTGLGWTAHVLRPM